jgi:hypothetical protein
LINDDHTLGTNCSCSSISDNPDTPSNPDTPDNPYVPVVPDNPDKPDNPDINNTDPDTPDTNTTDPDNPENNTTNPDEPDNPDQNLTYILHKDIRAALFWIGEKEEQNTTLQSSAWDPHWMSNYGGEDTPGARNGYKPAGFQPKENPFYIALPYNDLDKNGLRKLGSESYIPWAKEDDNPTSSICKNYWVKLTANHRTAYAQWEDVGPYSDDDVNYVFGNKAPLNAKDKNGSAILISPAVRDYLMGTGSDENETILEWIFVDPTHVPDGPWEPETNTLSN